MNRAIKIKKGQKFWCCPHPHRPLDFAIAPHAGFNATTGKQVEAKYIAVCRECQDDDGFLRTPVALKLAQWNGDRPLVAGHAHPELEVTSRYTH
jgi:hypothetical protein